MKAPEVARAVAASRAAASALGLKVDDAVVLHNSNRLAVRLLPCDVLVRVGPVAPWQEGLAREVHVALGLAGTEAPVAGLDPRVEPRVYVRDGHGVTFWIYHEPVPPEDISPSEYADALERFHAGLRTIDLPARHFLD